MATLEELQARLDTLREAQSGTASEVSYNGESVKFRPDHEMKAAIQDLERQIAAMTKKPVRRILVGTTKGF